MNKLRDFMGTRFVEEYITRHKAIIIYSFLIAIVCYGYELFNFSLSIDEEMNSFVRAVDMKTRILNGRWGTYFLRILLFPNSVLPYLPTLFTISCIALTSILFINSENGDLKSKIIFSTIFISFPIHSYYLAFNFFNFSVGIGMLLTVLSFLLAKKAIANSKNKKLLFLLSILLLTFSFSTYQGILNVFILLVLTHLLLYLLNNEPVNRKEVFNKIGGFVMIFFAAFITYKLIDIGLNQFYVDLAKEKIPYVEGFLSWGKYPVPLIISGLFKSIFNYLSGKSFYGGFSMISVFVLIPFLVCMILLKFKGISSKIYALIILFSLVLTPFLVMIMVGSDLPPRAMLALPFFLAILWWLVYQYLGNWLRRIVLVASLLLFVSNTYHTTRLFYTSYVTWQADRDMANRIIERIYSLDLPESEKIPVAFIGKYQHKTNELFMDSHDIFGSSFFNWDNGKPNRMVALFKTIGIANLKVVPPTELIKISNTTQSMPYWPNNKSVALVDNIVVVKLSN